MVQQYLMRFFLCMGVLLLAACNPQGWPDTVDLTSAERIEVLSTAEQYDGVPYEWGGNSMTGMDCSGLIVEAMYEVFGRGFVNQKGEVAREVNANELIRYNSRPIDEPERGDWVAFDVDWDGVYEHISIFDSYQYDGDGNLTIMVFDASTAGSGAVEYRLIEDLDDKYHYFVRPQRVN